MSASMFQGSRISRFLLYALCAVGPVVFSIKLALRPDGDTFGSPAPVPAVPVILFTVAGLDAADLDGARSALPLPRLSALLRDSTQFNRSVAAAEAPQTWVRSVASSSLINDQGLSNLPAEIRRQAAAKKLEFRCHAVSNSTIFTTTGLASSFDDVMEQAAAAPAGLIQQFLLRMPRPVPPRFLIWFHFDAGAAKEDRSEWLRSVDAAAGHLVDWLQGSRIASDGLLLFAAHPTRPAPDGVLRGMIAVQCPFEYRSGTRCPVSISSIDLAPTALELLRLQIPPSFRGRPRTAELRKFVSFGPALAGPFSVNGESLFLAEDATRTVWASGDGRLSAVVNELDPRNRDVPAGWLEAISGAAKPR